MKRVVGTALLSLSFVVGPGLVDRAGLAGFASEAAAQPAPPPTDAVTEVARQRYKEGVKAYEAGKFEDARAAFLQAYALKRVPAVLLNLGQSELRTQPPHTEEAGNHLQQFLREHTAATPEERAAAEKGIADVKKKSGLVAVTVDAPGADIAIDGTVVGKSPMADPVFVKPGKHVISATLGAKTVNDAFDAQVGATKQISLTVGGAAPPPVPPPVTPPMAPLTPPAPTPDLPPPGVTPPPGPTPEPTGGQTFGQWYGKKPLAWVTTGVAGVGLLGGIIFSVAAASASSTTNSAADQIRQHLASHPVPNNTPCAADGSGQADAMGYETACQTLRDDISAYHTDVALAATGWVLFGVGGVATVTYAMVDWYPHRKGSAPTTGDVKVVPVLSPTVQGLTVTGRF